MRVLITGVSGTGKSTISKALKERGIFSLDFSEVPGMCFWQDKKTKEKVEYSPIQSPDWYEKTDRTCDIEKLKEILDQYVNIVMTGVASGNYEEYFPLFDKVILLQCDPETFVHRMETRTVSYGKTKVEQEDAVKWQKEFDPALLSLGAISISTEGELRSVVDRIVAEIN